MKKFIAELNGLSPYYFTRPTEDKTPKTIEDKIKVAKNRAYFDENFNVYAPGEQIRAVIKSGVTIGGMKIGRSTKRPIDFLNSTLFCGGKLNEGGLVDPIIYFKPEMKLEDLEIVSHFTVTSPGQKSQKAQLLYFAKLPMANNWKLTVHGIYGDVLEKEFVHEALVTGGIYAGIGGRRNRGCGRFEVEKFELI